VYVAGSETRLITKEKALPSGRAPFRKTTTLSADAGALIALLRSGHATDSRADMVC
jgi:hypothetical protein